eukprot:jgi/Botrbrau1/11591/Bobra.247_1s0012.1
MMGRRKSPPEVLPEENNSGNILKNPRREKTILRANLETQRCLLEEINQDHQQMDSMKHEVETAQEKKAKLQDLLQSMSLDMEAKTDTHSARGEIPVTATFPYSHLPLCAPFIAGLLKGNIPGAAE